MLITEAVTDDRMLAGERFDLVGIDVEERNVSQAREETPESYTNLVFQLGDAYSLSDFDTHCVDLVICR